MSFICENCGKGRGYGHAVSHAKVRLGRVFKPNLQQIPVIKNGFKATAKLCTKCIKRLKKDGKTGIFRLFQIKPKTSQVKLKPSPIKKKVVKVKEKDIVNKPQKASLDISSIIGSKG